MLEWAAWPRMDPTVNRDLPMGEIDADRTDQYLPLSQLSRRSGASPSRLTDIPYKTGRPARYRGRPPENRRRLGFITPMNPTISARAATGVRLTAPARSTCVSVRTTWPICVMRCAPSEGNELAVLRPSDEAIGRKPKGAMDFVIDAAPCAPPPAT